MLRTKIKRTDVKLTDCHMIDISKLPLTQYGIRIGKGHPKICLVCKKPIRKGKAWRKDTSAEDP